MNGNEAYEEQFKSKINKIIQNNPDKDYLKGFYNYLKGKYSTKHSYLYYAVTFMNLNKKQTKELTLDDYNEYLALIKDKTASYQISVYSGLKKFSLYLFASKRCDDDPMKYIPRPDFEEGIETVEKRENGYLTTKEIKQYISTIDKGAGSDLAIARQKEWKERDVLIIKLFLYTGLRCSALYKLNVSNIDYNNKTLIAVDKGGKLPNFPLNDEMMKYINDWLKKRDVLLENNKDEQALFISNQKRRMDQSSISRIVKKYAESIEDKNITPHKLRATCGTHLLNETKDIYLVQKYLGHSNPKTTELYIRGQKNSTMEKGSNIMSKIIN